MNRDSNIRRLLIMLSAAAVVLWPAAAFAHCDGLDGPVVKAAQEALASGDVNLALIWVGEKDDAEIRRVFERTRTVRTLGPAAKEVADTHFFETLVRLHRAGEGAPFTGLKPAGRDLGAAIPAADQALSSGNLSPLITLLLEQLRAGLFERYQEAAEAKTFKSHDVEAGRAYVKKYVAFIHYVERLSQAATTVVEGHHVESQAGAHSEP